MKYIILQNSEHKAIVDDEDFDLLNKYMWRIDNLGYVVTQKQIKLKRKAIKMHRLVNCTPNHMETDHINRDKLDNRKCNLRTVSRQQNIMNTGPSKQKQYKGTFYSKKHDTWHAKIVYNGEYVYLGTFENEEDAAIAYNSKAKELFGDYAFLNDVDDKKVENHYKKIGKSSYLGVTWKEKTKKWQARIQVNKKRNVIGYFDDKHEAAKAYNEAAIKHLGNKARLNKID